VEHDLTEKQAHPVRTRFELAIGRMMDAWLTAGRISVTAGDVKLAGEFLEQTGWKVEDAEVGKNLVLELKFGPNRERSIAGIKRISKPGLRVYAKSTSLPKVLGGLGVAIISTSGGLLTDKQANKRGVGGEVLAYVW